MLRMLVTFLIGISQFETTRVLDKCNSTSECPLNSVCLARGCEGDACLCAEEFVPSEDLGRCLKGADLDRSCDGVSVLCRDKMAVCDNGRCRCRSSFTPASDNLRCKYRPFLGFRFALLGEYCDNHNVVCQRNEEQFCDLTQSVCACRDGLRPATAQELRAEPFREHECRARNYSLTLQVTEENCPEPDLPVRRTVEETCVSYNNCPRNADCLPRGCHGTICVCKQGYYPANNRTICKPVAYLGESCDQDRVCYRDGLTTSCVGGRCECLEGFSPTEDGRCRANAKPPLGNALYGEPCGTAGGERVVCSELWTACSSVVDGACVCQYGTREATDEEIHRDVTNLSPCRLIEYSLEVPEEQQCERLTALSACQTLRKEELFWRGWFKEMLRRQFVYTQSADWDWKRDWDAHREKIRRCSELIPPTDNDNWSEEFREIRIK